MALSNGQGLADVFKATAKQEGMEVVSEEFTTDKATDFMAILKEHQEQETRRHFLRLPGCPGGADAAPDGATGPVEREVFGGAALCTEKLPDLASKAGTVKNVTCATGGASIQKMQGGAEWKKKYDAKFPGQFQI